MVEDSPTGRTGPGQAAADETRLGPPGSGWAVDSYFDVTYRIDFIGTKAGFNAESKPADGDECKANDVTRLYSNDIGAVLKSAEGTSASYTIDGSELYVRAVVTSSRLHPNPSEPGEFERAWVQPIVIPRP